MSIFVDFFSTLSKEKNKTNGGANFAWIIVSRLAEFDKNLDIVLLCPSWYKSDENCDTKLQEFKNVRWVSVSSVCDYDFPCDGILFYPLIHRLNDFKDIILIKKI